MAVLDVTYCGDYASMFGAAAPRIHKSCHVINRVNVPFNLRGRGFASKLLKELIADADSESIQLCLWISPSDGLNYLELEAWYLRHGFEEYEGLYIRNPKPRPE